MGVKGKGGLFLRGSVYYARWRINGKLLVVSTGTTIKKEAEEFLERESAIMQIKNHGDRLAIIQRHIENDADRLKRLQAAADAIPLGRLSDEFERSPRRPDSSPDMLSFYRGVVARFARYAGATRSFQSITAKDADEYAAALTRETANGTYNKHLNGLSLVWRVVGRDYNLANPWEGIPRKRSDSHIRRPITDVELDRVLAMALGELRIIIALGAFAGLRLGDACRLRWDNVIGDEILVTTAKTGAAVAIPLHERLAEALEPRKPSGFVCPFLAERYAANSTAVCRRVQRLFAKAGIETAVTVGGGQCKNRPDCTFHSLRHYFVTKAISSGIPAPIVRELVGHSSYLMTDRYTHIDGATLNRAFAKMVKS